MVYGGGWGGVRCVKSTSKYVRYKGTDIRKVDTG